MTRPQGTRSEEERDTAPPPLGKGGTQNVAGSGPQQPEIAEGPVEGLEPGERTERGPWHPPVESDPPPAPGTAPGEGA
ncbi:hypothetical protein [Streptomyces sp. ODS28]|uniref:hypothetical protein n=1 Tax=Streptomyces sp. ODS28 TaxID=3136688 RepID=UPI0031EE514A